MGKKREELEKILSKYRKNNGYDCIVPGSGGKDSSYTAHILKYKFGMNPLTVTWAPHLYTNIGWKNFTNWMHIGGLDNILFTPNGKLHRYLTRLAFKFIASIPAFYNWSKNYRSKNCKKKFNVPLVIYGENQAEYGNNINENESPLMNAEFFTNNKSQELSFGGISAEKIMKDKKFSLNDFEPYLPVDKEDASSHKIKVMYLGYFLKWDPQECYYYASKNSGFKSNTERTEGSYSKYSSIDDKIDPFHYYTTFIKFGIGRATYDASQEIRNDKIDRDEGIALVKRYDHEFPKKIFSRFLGLYQYKRK